MIDDHKLASSRVTVRFQDRNIDAHPIFPPRQPPNLEAKLREIIPWELVDSLPPVEVWICQPVCTFWGEK